MQIVARFFLGAFLIQTPLSFAARATEIDACSGRSQADLRICLENKAKASEAELSQAEQTAVTALTRWDEDQRYRSAAATLLKTSNKSFIQFRAAQCEFAAALGGGAAGNARELRRLTCVADLNYTRAETLRQQVTDLSIY